MDGATVIAKVLRKQGVAVVFGVVGVPVVEVAEAIQKEGIQFIGMRNEQAASYAASVHGYLTGRPGICLVVSGPGLVHALAGMMNAMMNGWPILILAGAASRDQEWMGAFQETDQLSLVKNMCKFSARPNSLKRLPFFLEKAIRTSFYGRPGVSYLDLPADMIKEILVETSIKHEIDSMTLIKDAPRPCSDLTSLSKALSLLKNAERPLMIIGKGASYAQAENELRAWIDRTGMPFLATPMGKGIVSDYHSLNVNAARSLALKEADVIMLVGARLNWILHFGMTPRFHPHCHFIQIDICAEEFHNNIQAELTIQADIKAAFQQFNHLLSNSFPEGSNILHDALSSTWLKALAMEKTKNREILQSLVTTNKLPMSYYQAYAIIRDLLPSDYILINEGAKTMDIGRSMLMHDHPRSRLDAGTYATMGIGLAYAIAASCFHGPNRRIICIQGDSAFGFGAMEFETCCRLQLPIIVIIMNNNGIYHGLDKETYMITPSNQRPSTALLPNAQYEKIAEAFHAPGYLIHTPQQLQDTLHHLLQDSSKVSLPAIVNILIDPYDDQHKSAIQHIP